MCKYCEALTGDKMCVHKYRELLKTNYFSQDFSGEDVETMVSIIPPNPISQRHHKEDGLTSLMEIYIADDHRKVHHMYIPIKYCPICGRDLSNA